MPSSWKTIGDEDPRLGIPTTYYASVQLTGDVTVIDDADGIAAVLRTQLAALQPGEDVVDPSEHASRLRVIRGLRLRVDERAGEVQVRRQCRPRRTATRRSRACSTATVPATAPRPRTSQRRIDR